ncbi:MAG: type II toxin-antitoxin system ParD family antitoxin [Rubrivivax sp.]|nr:type II toxin-antitoxin system ParD family antitoxin [Rubrivivax sp.]
MATPALQVDLPEPLRRYVDERVQRGDYADAGEYLRDLVRRDHEAQAVQRLRELIEEGLASGPARPMTEADWTELRARATRAAK